MVSTPTSGPASGGGGAAVTVSVIELLPREIDAPRLIYPGYRRSGCEVGVKAYRFSNFLKIFTVIWASSVKITVLIYVNHARYCEGSLPPL
jgi:hypothetical protein